MDNNLSRPVKIITVSTSDLPSDIAEANGIVIIPEYVRFGENLYKDRLEMDVERFLLELEDNPDFPKTTPPTPEDYHKVFSEILHDGYDILYLGLSNKISSGLKLAQIAKDSLDDERIFLFDTETLSIGIGLIGVVLAKLALQGASAGELLEQAEELKNKSLGLFMVDNLEFLKKGGRLSSAQAFVGGLLQVKPLLHLDQGEIKVLEKMRGNRERAMKHMFNLALEGHNEDSIWGIAHIGCREDGEKLSGWLEELGFKPIIAPCGVVVGTHCGPGGLGIFRLR